MNKIVITAILANTLIASYADNCDQYSNTYAIKECRDLNAQLNQTQQILTDQTNSLYQQKLREIENQQKPAPEMKTPVKTVPAYQYQYQAPAVTIQPNTPTVQPTQQPQRRNRIFY